MPTKLNPDARVYAGVNHPDHPVVCQWFAKCTNPANGLRTHPILKQVPICCRCDEKVEQL